MENGIEASSLALFENLRLELRRGLLTVAVLSQLRTERYGYTLRKALEHGVPPQPPTAPRQLGKRVSGSVFARYSV